MGMTTLEAANMLALSPGQVAHLCKTGKLKARKFGPLWEISPESLTEFKKTHHPSASRAIKEKHPAEVSMPGEELIARLLGEVGVLNSLNGLEQKAFSDNPFQVFASATIIKGLLADHQPGIEKLGSDILDKIEFKVGRFYSPESLSPPFTGTHRLIQDSFDPSSGTNRGNATVLCLNEFLLCKLLMTRGRYYTLEQIISFEAMVLSEIKTSNLQKQLEAFHRISELISPGGITPAVRQLKAIGRVTLKALEPFRERIGVEWPGPERPQLLQR